MILYYNMAGGDGTVKKWTISELDKNKVREISQKYGLPVFTSMLLTIRKLTTQNEIERFFSADNEPCDPMSIKDMDKAVERIKRAVAEYEKICVYGDYDCDGVTSTAILYSYLESVCADVMYYIPSRESEGYGMNKTAVSKLCGEGVKLIITVDNGISAIDEINYASSLGIDVVVTDHHKPQNILPCAAAVVDPHRSDDNSRFKDYSGAGLALKLLTALEGDYFSVFENYSDLAAIGTVADLVPVNGENRDIIKAGMFNIENTERIGISELIEKSETERISSGTIGFRLAPRINAAGRLSSPYDALELFLTEDNTLAAEKAELLNSLNSKRKSIETKIYEQIEQKIKDKPNLANDRIMVISSEGWNAGVIGIVSSRITEKYGKPSIVISEDGEVCKASGRSINGFSLVDAVFSCSQYLEKFGGHPMAVGFSIKRENIDDFRRAVNDYAGKLEKMPLLSVKLDCNLNPNTITTDMVHQLQMFEPFGYGNPKPVFGLNNMFLEKVIPVGGGKHLKLAVTREKARLNIMKFSTSPEEFPYSEGDTLDFAVGLDINLYQGKEYLSFSVKDIRLSGFDTESAMYEMQDYEMYKSGRIPKTLKDTVPDRNEFAVVYRCLKKSTRRIYSLDALCSKLMCPSIKIFKLLNILDIMNELCLISYSRISDMLNININEVSGKVDLNSSSILKKLKEDINNA